MQGVEAALFAVSEILDALQGEASSNINGSGGLVKKNAFNNIYAYASDYKLYGKKSYVFNNKEFLHALYRTLEVSMNDWKISGEAFDWWIANSHPAGMALAKVYDITAKSTLKSLNSMNAVAASSTAMNAVIVSSTAMNAVLSKKESLKILITMSDSVIKDCKINKIMLDQARANRGSIKDTYYYKIWNTLNSNLSYFSKFPRSNCRGYSNGHPSSFLGGNTAVKDYGSTNTHSYSLIYDIFSGGGGVLTRLCSFTNIDNGESYRLKSPDYSANSSFIGSDSMVAFGQNGNITPINYGSESENNYVEAFYFGSFSLVLSSGVGAYVTMYY